MAETMAETTPLLPRANRPPRDLPIFLGVCHSPWLSISQKALLAVRAIVAAFLSIVLTLDILYEINDNHTGKQSAFKVSNVSLAIQILYYWITMVGVSPLRCINLLTSPTVLDTAAHSGTSWSIVSRGTSQGDTYSPDTNRSLGPNVN